MAGLQFIGLEEGQEKKERKGDFSLENAILYSYVNPLNS